MNPFDVAKSINEKTGYPIQNETDEKAYPAFMVNRVLGTNDDLIHYVEVMNQYYGLPNQLQCLFLYKSVPKKKRYQKWVNKEELYDPEIINLISEFFCINTRLAMQYRSMLDDSQINAIRIKMDKGGKNGGKYR